MMNKLASDLHKAVEKRFGRNIVVNDNLLFFIKEYVGSHAQDLFDIQVENRPRPDQFVDEITISIYPKQNAEYLSLAICNSKAMYETLSQEQKRSSI
jgi:hypothetical protein